MESAGIPVLIICTDSAKPAHGLNRFSGMQDMPFMPSQCYSLLATRGVIARAQCVVEGGAVLPNAARLGGDAPGRVGVVCLTSGQDRVGDARELVGERHSGDVGMAPGLQCRGPSAERIILALGDAQHRAGAVDEQLAQVDIPALADPKQALLATGGVLARHQTEPGGHCPAIVKQAGVFADGGQQGGGAFGTDTRWLHQRLGLRVVLGDLIDLRIVVGDSCVEMLQLLVEPLQLGPKAPTETVAGVLEDLGQASLQGGAPLGNLDAVLQQQTAGLIDQRRSLSDGPTGPERVLAFNRDHWGIEVHHYILDWNWDEDRCRLRVGHGHENMTRLGRFAVGLIEANGDDSVAATIAKLARRVRRVFDYFLMTGNSKPRAGRSIAQEG